MSFDYSKVNMREILDRCYEAMDPIQRSAVSHSKTFKHTIFDIWLGVGKTFTALTAGLLFKPQRMLIICSRKNALTVWRSEVEKWFPEFADSTYWNRIKGTADQRHKAWKKDALFYITTGGSFLADHEWLMQNKIKFQVIVIDEPHRMGLRNRKSAGFKAVKAYTDPKYQPLSFIGMTTGTLTSKGNPQMWSYLHILDRQKFSSYWQFVDRYNIIVNGVFGREIIRPKNGEGLAQLTAPYIFRFSKEEASKILPPLRRIRLYTELEDNVLDAYKSMAKDLYIELENELLTTATVMSSYIKLRQLVCCPAIIDPSFGVGSAIEAVADKILENDEDPRYLHNIIFTPFLPSIPLFKDYLSEVLSVKPNKILTLQGGIEPEELKAVEDQFRKDPETMIISSLMFGESWNAETARAVYFPHFDWDQDNNEQAEGRARRKTSDISWTILAYYVCVKYSVTEDMMDLLNIKTQNTKLTYQDFARVRNRLLMI